MLITSERAKKPRSRTTYNMCTLFTLLYAGSIQTHKTFPLHIIGRLRGSGAEAMGMAHKQPQLADRELTRCLHMVPPSMSTPSCCSVLIKSGCRDLVWSRSSRGNHLGLGFVSRVYVWEMHTTVSNAIILLNQA